jgi:hypothetical protein
MKLTKTRAKKEIETFFTGLYSTGENLNLTDLGYQASRRQCEACVVALHKLVDAICELNDQKQRDTQLGLLCGSIDLLGYIVNDLHNVRVAGARNAILAQFAKRTKDEERDAFLMAAINAEIETHKERQVVAVSDKYARQLRPGILARLGVTEAKENTEWPSMATIKGRLRRIRGGQ